MAITVTRQTLVDGSRNLVVKHHLVSGAASDVTAQLLTDVSTYVDAPATVKIVRIESSSADMDIDLHWDATTDVDILTLPIGEDIYDFSQFGGLINNAGAGITGDIMFSTRGAAADTEATIILYMKKS